MGWVTSCSTYFNAKVPLVKLEIDPSVGYYTPKCRNDYFGSIHHPCSLDLKDPSKGVPVKVDITISTEEGLEPFPFYVPNAFTPNEDGINDALFVVGPENLFIAFSIYNRWGEILFTADSVATPWNGSVQNGGYYVQDGVYLWQLTTKGNLGETISHSGHLTVLR